MDLSVAEFALARGVSRQRALAMIRAGQVDAKRVGRSWIVNQREVSNRQSLGRPLSSRMAQLLLNAISGAPLSELESGDRFYVVRYVDRLRESEEPAQLLHSWLRSRQIRVINVAANPSDIPEIASDDRVVPSGISDERAGISAARELEGYVAEKDIERFIQSNLLVASDSPNVRLHVVSTLPDRPVSLGLVIADLADWNRPREDGRVADLLRSVEWNR